MELKHTTFLYQFKIRIAAFELTMQAYARDFRYIYHARLISAKKINIKRPTRILTLRNNFSCECVQPGQSAMTRM